MIKWSTACWRSEQHGVRYGRHWLDVLRYADLDENMFAAPGIYLWRDWVIRALNDDMPYDQFVGAQLIGYRFATRTADFGLREPGRAPEPRPDDMFALGSSRRARAAMARIMAGAVDHGRRDGLDRLHGPDRRLRKCHDHMYDPIKQSDFYAMKALFDPLVLRKVTLATPADQGGVQGASQCRGTAGGDSKAARPARRTL